MSIARVEHLAAICTLQFYSLPIMKRELAFCIVAGAGAAGLAARWLCAAYKRRRDLSLVSDSAGLIAAWRAIESQESEHGRLFCDPFAVELAGRGAVDAALAAAKPAGSRRWRLSNPACRVWWFDRAILSALHGEDTSGSSASSSGNGGSGNSSSGQPSLPPRQVVVLGAGMDARPWRLPQLPPSITWFEVDRGEAPAAKRRVLQRLGAALDPGDDASATHPLRVARWRQANADLSSPGWVDSLKAAGFDPGQPTLWVAEGLLMYLDARARDALLRRTAELSPPGSVLVAHNSTDEFLDLAAAALRRRSKASTSQGPAASADSAAAAHGSAGAASGLSDSYLSVFDPSLVATWLSGFPADPTKLLREAGWRLEQVTTRARIAAEACASLGVTESAAMADLVAFDVQPDVGEDRYAVFCVARR